MKRNAGAQAGESKLESRFAALTSGLLARKGFAAPSNSPIADPAEETDAYALEPTRKAVKAAPATKAAAPKETPKEAAKPAPLNKAEAAPAPAPQSKSSQPPEKVKPELRLHSSDRAAAAQMTIINERSYEAGYPDNPTPEEIAALEAEADEVVSYFENFGSDQAAAVEKGEFYGDADEETAILDDLEDFNDAEAVKEASAGPWRAPSVPEVRADESQEVRAGVTVQLTAREFMRLSLGASELGQSAQALIAEAIEEYLDARGVLSLGGCSCLEALTKKNSGA